MSKRQRRRFLLGIGSTLFLSTTLFGCRGNTAARVMNPWEQSGVGSDKAGGEVYTPLVASTTDKILARAQELPVQANNFAGPQRYKICFVGIENLSGEELHDHKENINATITQRIVESQQFEVLHERAVAAGLHQLGYRSDELFLPDKRRRFAELMGQSGNPVDFVLFAKMTSGTTQMNKDMQREYRLTMELVDLNSASSPISEYCLISKEYNKSAAGKMSSWWKK